ncbi:Myb/SANT-like DNA-binding domain protein [Rhynchospora pubera]|uniref:Myb/SANT-like DNA-binding domain protein n=1 Tax=Rhynchospora pubera TaxID=906938 RepID=A0AAV8E286_9POAL|nr:Myb/SANT-like DNA-binding domain protein [Rhynchospora pubera]
MSNQKLKYFRWSDQMDRVLNATLLEQHNLGNHLPSGWRLDAYEAVIEAISDKCHVSITRAHVINRLKTWNAHYNTVKAILSTDGFSWDWDVNMIKADSDEIWDGYIKDHPEAACYKTKIIENWGDLPLICEKLRRPLCKKSDPEPESGYTFQLENANAEQDNSQNTSEISLPVEIDFSEQEPFVEQEPSTEQEQQQHQQEEEQQNQQQKLPATDIVAPNYLQSWQKSTKKRKRVGKAIVLPVSQQQFSDAPLQRASAKRIFAELSNVKGLQDLQLLQVYDLLTEDERKFESFVALPNHLRRPWILMQLRK